MTRRELQQLRKAVRNVNHPEHMFYIEGKWFWCKWDGKKFLWKPPVGEPIEVTRKEVLEYIRNGEYILNYGYDYNDNENAEEI